MRKIPLNNLSRIPSERLESILKSVHDVIVSGKYLKANFTDALETEIGNFTGGKFVLSCGNGTDALKLAFLGLGLMPGDLILTTGNSGGYSSSAAFSCSLRVGLIDINLHNAQIDPRFLEDVLIANPETKAVVMTHLYGQMGDVSQIRMICDQFGVLLIEDCSQSFGAVRDSKRAGELADASTFSFYPTKNLGGMGDGGAVAFKNKSHKDFASTISQYGWTSRYVVENKNGFNSRMDELQAAILIENLKYLAVDNVKRIEILYEYKSHCPEDYVLIGDLDGSNVGHLAVLITPDRAKTISHFAKSNIETGIHYPILDCDQNAWRGSFEFDSIPNSKNLVERIVTIPIFPTMTDDEVRWVAETISLLGT